MLEQLPPRGDTTVPVAVVPVVPVHALSAVWGLLAVGVFGEEDTLDELNGMKGNFMSGFTFLVL